MKTIIEVDERYYSFDFTIKWNDRMVERSSYSDDYCNGMTPEEWESELKERVAVEQALSQTYF